MAKFDITKLKSKIKNPLNKAYKVSLQADVLMSVFLTQKCTNLFTCE